VLKSVSQKEKVVCFRLLGRTKKKLLIVFGIGKALSYQVSHLRTSTAHKITKSVIFGRGHKRRFPN